MRANVMVFLLWMAFSGCSDADGAPPGPQGGADAAIWDAGVPADRHDSGVPPRVEPALSFVDEHGATVESIRFSDAVAVVVTGLTPGRSLQVTATMESWASEAFFIAADDGTVDTSRDAPTDGSYTGVDADGLFWSMTSRTGQLASSANVVVAVDDGAGVALRATLERTTRIPGLRIIDVDAVGLSGTLYVPPGVGPFPALLAFGGSEGGDSGGAGYASELVADGYAVLALAYFGAPGLPAQLEDVPLEYFGDALAWLAAQPDVDAQRLGLIGGSRGGEAALVLAALHPEVKAVVADVPSAYVWGAVGNLDGDAWTLGGAAVPRLSSHGAGGEVIQTSNGRDALSYRAAFVDDVAKSSPAELEAARVKPEEGSAAIAMFAGADDQVWPSCDFVDVVMARLEASGHAAAHPDEGTCFEDAGHFLQVVNLPSGTSMSVRNGAGPGLDLALGGTAAGIARAGRARQLKLRAFLRRTLGP